MKQNGFENSKPFLEALQKGGNLEQRIEQFEKGSPEEKVEATQFLQNYLTTLSNAYTGLNIPVSADNPEALVKSAKKLLGTIYGKKLFRQFPSFVEDSIKNLHPAISYGYVLPELEKLAEKVGADSFDGQEYIETRNLIKKASKGELEEQLAYDAAKKTILEHITQYAKNEKDEELLKDAEELADIVAELWTETRATTEGKIFYTTLIYNEKVKPQIEENTDKIPEYARQISTTALANGYASKPEGFDTLKETTQDLLRATEYTELIKKIGPAGVYLRDELATA